MFNSWTINNFLPAFLVLLIEYLIIQPFQKLDASRKKRLIVAILVSITLLIPLSLLQMVALWFVGFLNLPDEAKRVDIYVNAYGFLALIWGCTWMAFVRPWLYRFGGLGNEQTKTPL